jgi:hypothetical protein
MAGAAYRETGEMGMSDWWRVTCVICGVLGYRKEKVGALMRAARHGVKYGEFHRCGREQSEREGAAREGA